MSVTTATLHYNRKILPLCSHCSRFGTKWAHNYPCLDSVLSSLALSFTICTLFHCITKQVEKSGTIFRHYTFLWQSFSSQAWQYNFGFIQRSSDIIWCCTNVENFTTVGINMWLFDCCIAFPYQIWKYVPGSSHCIKVESREMEWNHHNEGHFPIPS